MLTENYNNYKIFRLNEFFSEIFTFVFLLFFIKTVPDCFLFLIFIQLQINHLLLL